MPITAASLHVTSPFSEAEVISTARDLRERVGGKVSCGFVFATQDYRENLSDFLELIQVHGHVPVLAGCSGSGLIGTGVEKESGSGFSLLFLHLPDTEIHTIAFGENEAGWAKDAAEVIGKNTEPMAGWIVLGDPSSMHVERWLRMWNTLQPGIPCVGGLASGGGTEHHFFVTRDRTIIDSAVAIGFRGGMRLTTCVSQGCRPIGEPFTITGAEQNVVQTLGSLPAYERLAETVNALSPEDKQRASGNLFAGLAMSEYVDEFKTGDFLIRNLLGADPSSGALAMGALPRVGQTLQFQLRDAKSATDDFRGLLQKAKQDGGVPTAALLFSCAGRGEGLFGRPNHDASALVEHFGPLPSAGFFCNGEIGPVGAETFVHGYTASVAFFLEQ